MNEEEKRRDEQKRQDEQKRRDEERRRLDEERRRNEQKTAEERARQGQEQEKSQRKPEEKEKGGADQHERRNAAGDSGREISEGTAQTLSGKGSFREGEKESIRFAQERGIPIAVTPGFKKEDGGRDKAPQRQGEKPEQGQTPQKKQVQASPAVQRLNEKMQAQKTQIQEHIKSHTNTQAPGHER